MEPFAFELLVEQVLVKGNVLGLDLILVDTVSALPIRSMLAKDLHSLLDCLLLFLKRSAIQALALGPVAAFI